MSDTSLIFPAHAPAPRPKRYAPAQRYRPEALNEEYRHVRAPEDFVAPDVSAPSLDKLEMLRGLFDRVMARPEGQGQVIAILGRYNLGRISDVKKAGYDDVHASLVLALM